MTPTWWQELALHFEAKNGFPLPDVMRPHAESELLRLCPGPLLEGVRRIKADSDLSQTLIDGLSLGLTWFHREHLGISSLAQAFLHERRPEGTIYRIWSAGCSMGQEPYSIAMAFLELGLRPDIVATDLNREHLRRADLGIYEDEKLQTMPSELVDKYFQRTSSGAFQVLPVVRECVSFVLHNFATTTGPPCGPNRFDAVVCRNALIYYSTEHATRIVTELCASLRYPGLLLVGTAERPLVRAMGLTGDTRVGLARVDGPIPVDLPSGGSPSVAPKPRIAAAFPPNRPAPARIVPLVAKPVPTDPGPQPLLLEADRLARSHRMDECIRLLEKAVERYPLSPACHVVLGLNLKRSGRELEAIDQLRAARFLDSEGWLASYHLALCLQKQGSFKEAEQAFRDTYSLIEAGKTACSTEIPGTGELEALASTVAESCTSRLSSTPWKKESKP